MTPPRWFVRPAVPRASGAVGAVLALALPTLIPSRLDPSASVRSETAVLSSAVDLAPPVERGRDPLGLARTAIRPRVWLLLDTSQSMEWSFGKRSRFAVALDVIRHAVNSYESDRGEPLVHWRLATFQKFDGPVGLACLDPTRGAGLPPGSPPGPPVSFGLRCGGVVLPRERPGCDAEAARQSVLSRLPRRPNSSRTPNGIALYQLAAHIRSRRPSDPVPGMKDIILLITDGVDTCECARHPWLDFNDGPAGERDPANLPLRSGSVTPAAIAVPNPSSNQLAGHNAAVKAKAAFLTLNDGDPDADLGDIHVIGVAMTSADSLGLTNHLAWTASNLRHPAIHAERPGDLRAALDRVIQEVTLPRAEVRLTEPRLASVKELVASLSPPGSSPGDPPARRDALVAVEGASDAELARVLRLRAEHADNVLVSTGAELGLLRGHLRAFRTPPGGAVPASDPPIWDAGARLADRLPDDRLVLFHRPGDRRLRSFEPGMVTAADLGVAAGYLRELDGVGARTDSDAAEIVVRLIRGEELSVHPDTGTIYTPGGVVHFSGGAGTWKLREGLAAPAVVTNPLRLPQRVSRNRQEYEVFFTRHVNRRTMVYLPTSGGLLHAFAGDTGEEAFAYIPDDVLGPAPGEAAPGRLLLRDLAKAGIREAPGFRAALAARFSLAGSPVVQDVFDRSAGRWRTALGFGRFAGGRFVTVLDVSSVGDGWDGSRRLPRLRPGAPGLPEVLFNVGRRPGLSPPELAGLGETPEPLLAEVPDAGGGQWLAFLPAGASHPGDDSGEWLYALFLPEGRVRARFRLSGDPSAVIAKNGAIVPAAPWQPGWAASGSGDLTTRIYLGDLHGQIHRLDTSTAAAWDFRTVHRLGGNHPIATPLVVFPFPGRSEPHLLVVTGGDRRVPGGASDLLLLRDRGTGVEEVWRQRLPAGESPQGKPVVLTDGDVVEVVLATGSVRQETVSCDAVRTSDGVARLRAFNGFTGEPATGVLSPSSAVLSFGSGRIHGISLSSTGNMAVSVTQDPGSVLDAVIGDFKFKVRDGALEEIMLFVEGFRRSPL